MKELILIGAYCPDQEREDLLNKCVDLLQKTREEYDILICSHTYIPEYITKKVDYAFYDKNNDLIYDLNYLNQPWFSPFEGMTILSTFIGEFSTYLAVYRILISGLGFAKMFKYEKVHYIEYDTFVYDTGILYDNSRLIGKYDNVVFQKQERDYESNLAWPIGNFMSFKVDSIDDLFLTYDRNRLLEILKKSTAKTNEKITNDIMRLNNNLIYVKDLDEISEEQIQFALSVNTNKDSMNYWTVPFYNPKEDKMSVIVWNNKDVDPIDVSFIINDHQVISFKNIKKYGWQMADIGKIEDINKIVIIVNDKVKNKIMLDENNRSLFKRTNYAEIL
jgi:hypothetical protein